MNSALHLKALRWQCVELPLAQPLITGAGSIETREVVAIEAAVEIDGESVVGYGEAAPLTGWSTETTADCVGALASFETDVQIDDVAALDRALPTLANLPSLRFGLEVALLDATARRRGLSLASLLAPEGVEPRERVAVQYTLGSAPLEATLRAARRASETGYTALKLKVGADSLADDIERVRAVHETCPDIAIRLDANGAWTLAKAREAAEKLRFVDFIEQPVRTDDTDALATLADASPVDIAVDESCAAVPQARRIISERLASVVVLKPTRLGGLLRTLDIADFASQHDVRVVLSSLIESAVGRSAIAHLAASRPALDEPHGLATGSWLADDLVDEDDHIERGQLAVRRGPGIGLRPSCEFDEGGDR